MATQALSKKGGNAEFQRLEALSELVAKRVFAEQPQKSQYAISPAPLEHLMRRFGIQVNTAPDDSPLTPLVEVGLEGLATKSNGSDNIEGQTGWFNSDYNVLVFSRGSKSRFTLAHELAHVVLSKEYGQHEELLSGPQTELVCDLAAAMMLCPEQALVNHFKKRKVLTINEVEVLAGRLQISISLLLNRLRYLISRNTLSIDNIVLLVTLSRSRKRRENLAPRVVAACCERRWFVPINSRLSTLGLTRLQDAFYIAPLYFAGQTNETLKLWDYHIHSHAMFECDVRYKCYKWLRTGQMKDNSNASRIMLAVANRDADSQVND